MEVVPRLVGGELPHDHGGGRAAERGGHDARAVRVGQDVVPSVSQPGAVLADGRTAPDEVGPQIGGESVGPRAPWLVGGVGKPTLIFPHVELDGGADLA